MSGVAINVSALCELESAAETMAAFSFSAIEQTKGYRAALQAFTSRKRRLRKALAAFKANGFATLADYSAGAAPKGTDP